MPKKKPLSRKARNTKAPEDILAGHNPQVQEIAETLRKLISATAPTATEAAYPCEPIFSNPLAAFIRWSKRLWISLTVFANPSSKGEMLNDLAL